MLLKLLINLWKYYIKCKNNCTYLTVVGTSHLFFLKIHTFELLMCMTLDVISKPKNIVVLSKKLHLLSLQYNIYRFKYTSNLLSNVKCSFTVSECTKISSRNTATIESNMAENRLVMICMNMAGAFISPMGIATHLYRLYLIKKVVFRISSSQICYCQYLLQRLIDVEYFILPI